MGKKGKRSRKRDDDDDDNDHQPPPSPSDVGDATVLGGGGGGKEKNKSRAPPSLRPTAEEQEEEEEETMENLRFEDPYEDVYEEEEMVVDDDEDEEGAVENAMKDIAAGEVPSKKTVVDNVSNNTTEEQEEEQEQPKTWVPSMGLQSDEKLEMDPSAYKLYHGLTASWPCLSFDFIRDDWGEGRVRGPHRLLAVAGTQADAGEENELTVMKLTGLHPSRSGRNGKKKKKRRGMEEDSDSEEDSDDSDDDDDSSDDDDEEDGAAVMGTTLDPVLEHVSLPHEGGVNRVRVMRCHDGAGASTTTTSSSSSSSIVSTWSDTGKVFFYDIASCLNRFDRSEGKFKNSSSSSNADSENAESKLPFYTYGGHKTEGYAMDWSPTRRGYLATGDNHGEIHLHEPTENGGSNNKSFHSYKAYGSKQKHHQAAAVEDIQWSPTERTVLAGGECGGYVRIYDTRRPGKSMLDTLIHDNQSDVNVIAWNPHVTNLLASGSDDGVFSVWDLRTFSSGGGGGGGGKKKNRKGGASPANVEPLARFTCHRTPITSLEWHPTDESMIVVSDDDGAFIYDLSIEADPEEEELRLQKGLTGKKKKNQGKGEAEVVPPQLLFLHCGSELTKEVHWHPQISSLVMTTALNGFSVFIPSNL